MDPSKGEGTTSSKNFVPKSQVPAYFKYSSPQPMRRRYSNPTGGSTSSGFCSLSTNDSHSHSQSFELKPRRYSQPSSPFAYSNIANPLVRQEKASYSSLSFLPEVQTYLQFIDDSNPGKAPRSNSFSENSVRKKSQSRTKQRARSQSRSPNHQNNPFVSQSSDLPVLSQQGNYLSTPSTSRSNPIKTEIHEEKQEEENEDSSTLFPKCFERRRSSSTGIRTSFI